MLVDWKAEQDEMKEILGDEYMDYNLVMASTFGLPLGDGAIRGPLKKLIEDYNLPPVVFHSFRHSSVTYKLKLNGGDIKAVQGDSGHRPEYESTHLENCAVMCMRCIRIGCRLGLF